MSNISSCLFGFYRAAHLACDVSADMLREQDHKIRLAGLGDSERSDREGLLRAVVS